LVDRPEWYSRILEIATEVQAEIPSGIVAGLRGIPIHTITTDEAAELHRNRVQGIELDELLDMIHGEIPSPFPPPAPGIWIEMNKGPHIKIKEADDVARDEG
jgi:hypothetical protein